MIGFGLNMFRKRKGSAWVKTWMAKRCALIEVDDKMTNAMSEYGSFIAQFQGSAGRRKHGTN